MFVSNASKYGILNARQTFQKQNIQYALQFTIISRENFSRTVYPIQTIRLHGVYHAGRN
jgi:hypothetical protein